MDPEKSSEKEWREVWIVVEVMRTIDGYLTWGDVQSVPSVRLDWVIRLDVDFWSKISIFIWDCFGRL